MTRASDSAMDGTDHRYGSRTHGSKVQPDGPKTGTPAAGFKPKGSRDAGDPRGNIER